MTESCNGDCEYVNTRRVVYGEDRAQFIPVCVKCHRFVKHDPSIKIGENGISDEPNATCSRCGRTHMHFEGFM